MEQTTFWIALAGLLLGITNAILTFYYQYWKRARLKVKFHPEISDDIRIPRGNKFRGRIEVTNVGNVSTTLTGINVYGVPRDMTIEKLEEESGEEFPLELIPGRAVIIQYILDAVSRPCSVESGFVVLTLAETRENKFKLHWE